MAKNLDRLLRERGVKVKVVAQQLGLNKDRIIARRRNPEDFTLKELIHLGSILGLSVPELVSQLLATPEAD